MTRIVRKYNGKLVTKEELDVLCPPRKDWFQTPPMVSNTYTEHKPLVSDGCGVMKSQVEEARQMVRQHGIQGAQVADNGQVHFTSRRARKEFLAARGLVDSDGGYSD